MSDSSKSSTKNRKYCKLCTKNYAYSSGLTRHMLTVHVHENVIPDPPLLTTFFKCTKCSKIFGRKFNRDRHEIACSNTTCGVSTSKQREEAEMMSRGGGSGGDFKCQKCQKIFQSAHSLSVHSVSCFEIVWSQQQQAEQQLARMYIELERLQTELRTTIIHKNNLEVKFDWMQKKVIQAQTKVYPTSKKDEKITDYINWLGM